MMDQEVFIQIMLDKTTKRRAMKGLPKLTRPQIKKAYRMIQKDVKFSKMSDDKIISYFIGWFMVK